MTRQSIIKRAKSLLKGIDSFGQPILLSYRGKTAYRTWPGGVLTISLIGLIVALSFEAVISLILRENIKVAFSEIYEIDPYKVQVSGKEKFFLTMGLQPDILNNQSRKHFEIKAFQRINRRLKNGTIEYTYININLTKCKSENFPEGHDYIKNNQQNWLCPDLDTELIMEGKHQSEFFKFLQITVEKCDNSTNNNTCAPREETEAIMKKDRIYMNFAFSNKIINLQDYNNPYSDFMESSTFFIIDPRQYYKQVDLFFMNNTIIKDDDLWFYQSKKTSEVTFENFREQVMDITSNWYAAFFFRSSFKRGQYLASSEKLTLMLARLGGLLSVIYSFVEVIARLYNRKKLLVSLANFLYNFVLSTKEPAKEQDRTFDSPEILSINNMDSLPGQMNAKRIFFKVNTNKLKMKSNDNAKFEKTTEIKVSQNDSTLLAQIQKYLKMFPKIKFGLQFNFFRKKEGNPGWERSEILRKALKRVDRDVDIINILRKSKEIDKIKDFLFDEEQRILFEFFPKPNISMTNSKKPSSSRRTHGSSSRRYTNEYIKKLMSQKGNLGDENAHGYMELYRAYINISSGLNKNDKNNTKLISFLGQAILNIFKKQQMRSLDE